MAWPNIIERRAKVKAMMAAGLPERHIRLSCSVEFDCSIGAVKADIHYLNGHVAHLSAAIRKRIRIRDGYVCQYCGIQRPYSGIIEHVVPFALGGPAADYNLVFACQKCNATKRRAVWIPNNLKRIMENHPEWCEKVVLMAKNNYQ